MNAMFSPDFLSNVISSLLGTVIGALLAYFFAVKQFKIQKEVEIREKQIETTLSYFQELTSNEFSLARSEANKAFEKHNPAQSFDGFFSSLSEEEGGNIRSVIAYFRRLQLAIEYKQVDNQMVVDLLSGEFLWWYFKWLDKMVPKTWDTRQNIDKLHNWLKRVMSAAKYEQSIEVAQTNR